MPYPLRHPILLENKYTQLLVAQILLLLVPTMVQGAIPSILAFIILVSSVVAFTLRTFEVRFHHLAWFIVGTFLVGFLEFILVLFAIDYQQLSLFINGFHLIITVMAVVFILGRIFSANMITGDSIRGGICVYFLVGYSFFFVYRILSDYVPTSFSRPAHLDHLFSLLYCSFTTLTSVGYGDITPTTPLAMAIANLEAIFGQMYSAIVMARLVSQYLNSRSAHPH
ncbi:ion channel [Thermosynechococcus sp. HN-54]|uniref:potassium channel family protein n=1 Tax=Thermosynechococcus sp. HN-54 TaxID=2933959 RepID=UPI00202CEF9F|nr:potassium channel family protein [Thermosynechococcus sp. HN-54]URR34864.1 ion channel [Thermosynechococcus sp. HN-54]